MKKLNCTIIIVLTILLFSFERSSLFAETIQKSFGGSADDIGLAIINTHDSGYMLAGYTFSYGAGNGDGYLIKTDSKGNVIWANTYGGAEWDEFRDILQNDDGSYMAFGCSKTYGSIRGKFYLVKIDNSGNVLWEKTYGHNDWTRGGAIESTSDNGYVLIGQSTETDAWTDVRLTKVDSDGIEQWTQFYPGTLEDWGTDVKQTSDNGFIWVGYTGREYTNNAPQARVVKTNSEGVIEWDKQWGGSSWESFGGVILTQDGGYAIAGHSSSYGAGNLDGVLLKMDSVGNIEWYKTYGGTENDSFNRLFQDPNTGHYFLSGHSKSYSIDGKIWVIETDEFGNEIGNNTYGNLEASLGSDIVYDPNNGFAVISQESMADGNENFYLVIESEQPECLEDSTGAIDIIGACGTCGGSVSVPNQINNAPNNISAGGYDVIIPDSMTYAGFTKGSLIPSNFTVDVNFVSPNIVRVGFFKTGGTEVITAGSSGTVVNLEFDLAASCSAGQMTLTNLKDDIATWTTSGGCLNLNCCPAISGDINDDGEITPGDALYAFEAYLGICPTSCGVDCETVRTCGDVNGDGDITPADALCIFQKYLADPQSCLN